MTQTQLPIPAKLAINEDVTDFVSSLLVAKPEKRLGSRGFAEVSALSIPCEEGQNAYSDLAADFSLMSRCLSIWLVRCQMSR